MEKKFYKPEMKIITFDVDDIIVASDGVQGGLNTIDEEEEDNSIVGP